MHSRDSAGRTGRCLRWRARRTVEGQCVGANDDELDAGIDEQNEQITEVLVQALKRHRREDTCRD